MVEVASEIGRKDNDPLVGARLSRFRDQWRRDKWAYLTISKGAIWTWLSPPPPYKPFHQKSSALIRSFLRDLLQAGAIVKTSFIAFQARLFSVPKKGTSKRRVILDISLLNKSIVCPKFKMTTIRQVRQVLPRGCWTASVDLKDAYWHVPVHRSFQKFLGFSIEGQRYRFRVLPFGLNVAPLIFTRVSRVILKILRLKGISVLAYLDDWLIWAPNFAECQKATWEVVDLLKKMGFLINDEKSRLKPSRRFTWLGLRWTTKSSRLSLPPASRKEITRDIRLFVERPWSSRRKFERVLGKLQFASVIDPVCKTLLKEANKFLIKFARRGLRDVRVRTPPQLSRFFRKWFLGAALERSALWRPPPPSLDVHTDASLVGWGFHSSDGRSGSGKWSETFQRLHINVLELATVYIALKALRPLPGSHVRVHADNMTTVHCINRRGSSKSPALNSWILSLGLMLRQQRTFLTAFHVAGVSNVVADALSRDQPIDSEWSLDQDSFQWMCTLAAPPQVDLFATHENHQIPNYVSPILDPLAVGKDAFLLDWNRWEVIYLFPPRPMILPVLEKLNDFRGRAYIVAPFWPNQAWFPLLESRSSFHRKFPNPRLSQRVGRRDFSCSSKKILHLAVWIF